VASPGCLRLPLLVQAAMNLSKAMPDSARAVGVVRFGPYEADFLGAELRKNGKRLSSKRNANRPVLSFAEIGCARCSALLPGIELLDRFTEIARTGPHE
jgi:hypothetical protein